MMKKRNAPTSTGRNTKTPSERFTIITIAPTAKTPTRIAISNVISDAFIPEKDEKESDSLFEFAE